MPIDKYHIFQADSIISGKGVIARAFVNNKIKEVSTTVFSAYNRNAI